VNAEVYVGGKLALTTEQAFERAGDRWPSVGALRAWIDRNEINPAGYVTKNVPVYYPADLGIEE
jgi:hypothetical protein